MPPYRSQRIAEAIREVVSTAILFEVADPRIHAVTVLRAEVSGDLRHATVYVSIMGTQAEQKRAMDGLHHAAGFLQARVAARLQTRFTPVLSFKLDDSVKKSIELSRLIDEAVSSDQRSESSNSEEAHGDTK
jgi:ribosome-binding factor A